MHLTICEGAIAIILAAGGAIFGTWWIAQSYERCPKILSHAGSAPKQDKSRGIRLAAVLWSLFFFTLLRFDDCLTVLSALVLIYFCVLFTFTDIEQRVLFDRMVIPFALLGLFFSIVSGAEVLDHLGAAAASGLAFLLLAVLTRGGIGGGDIKLVAAIALWTGSDQALSIALGGIILSGLAALCLLASRRLSRSDYFPYAPGFAIAAILVTLLG